MKEYADTKVRIKEKWSGEREKCSSHEDNNKRLRFITGTYLTILLTTPILAVTD
jgi:hypothetical protein